ncbi:GNAT family N-acetyltransferase [Desulfotruncus alcoholivorax]|uniref:GNAT family N-acetyltransferase n=1 Tax=Desulfotruncus alcoholivorax TaxID=265477 RepID=UPI00041C8D4F|nr:GNAT family N-acetyltransferase [Desulfotruncus alcoholivorax]
MQQYALETPQGTVYIEGPCPGDYLAELTMNDKLTNFRPPEKQKDALIMIAEMPVGMIYIARHEKEIAGYVTFHPSDESSRWIKHPRVLELGGIEISSDWRRMKLAENLLKVSFQNPELENYIVITMEMCWHWDTRNTKLDIWAYQRVLTNLFGSVGMQRTPTDDPDIIEHPANVLMARIGKNVSKSDIELFESMKFQRIYNNAINFL